MQGDFYTKGEYGHPGLQPFDMNKAIKEQADYVVFNGSVGALTGDNAITAEVGETVRLYMGNGGPNLVSSFHVIGEIFDRVHIEGGSAINENVQTTLIPAGGAAIIEFKVDVPGTFILVDHSIFRAFNKGALGMLAVGGAADSSIYSGTMQEGIYLPEGGTIQTTPDAPDAVVATTVAERISIGRKKYANTCQACHQDKGQGIPNAFPPLANSDYLVADIDRAIGVILHGLSGEVTVNGKKYDSMMPGQVLTDEQTANVLTFVLHDFNNSKVEVTPAMVAKVRAAKK